MLNIDYGTPKRFLISFGIVLIFFGFVLQLGSMIFLSETLDNVNDVMLRIYLSNVDDANDKEAINNFLNTTYKEIHDKKMKSLDRIDIMVWTLFIVGFIFFTAGLLLLDNEKWGRYI